MRKSRRTRNDLPWSRRIREARYAANLTQGGLATRVAVSQSSVADWEAGLKKPSIDRFEAIASATGTTASWLIFGINEASAAEVA